MKKNFSRYSYYLTLLICLIYIIPSLFLQITYYKFDSANVKKNIEILSSKEYAGRLTGSPENDSAAQFIENNFKDFGLQPLDGKYQEYFDVISPVRNNNTADLRITSAGKIIRQYSYGTDFKENMLSFKSSSADFTKSDYVEILTSSIIITQNNKKYLFKVNPTKDFSFRSSFNCDSQYEFCINITTEVYNDILDSLRNNCTVSVKLPYTTAHKSTSNLVGVIRGTSNTLPPLILTAHYDHLGVDALGNYYNGALDNASGTAFLIELSKNLSSLIKPKRDIIFVAFSGEEFGLLGSKDFVSKHNEEIKNSDVINFDMIGAPHTPISFIIGTSTSQLQNPESFSTLENLKTECLKNNITYNVKIQDSSDHASFNNAGINALTVCHSDLSKIHTPKDNASYIDSTAISQVYTVVEKEICDSAYNKYIFLLYKPSITLTLIIVFLSIIAVRNHEKLCIVLLHKNNI